MCACIQASTHSWIPEDSVGPIVIAGHESGNHYLTNCGVGLGLRGGSNRCITKLVKHDAAPQRSSLVLSGTHAGIGRCEEDREVVKKTGFAYFGTLNTRGQILLGT